MNGVEFREISLENLDEIIDLEVRQDQTNLVADNLYSIAQSSLDPSGWCRGVYIDGKPVGFFSVKEQESGSRVYICRFMIDRRHQGQGVGRSIMGKLLTMLFSSPLVKMVDLAVSRDEGSAEEFYKKCGFTPTEEPYRGGWRMVLPRD